MGSPILATDYKQAFAGDPGNPAQGEQKWTENYFPYGQRREQNGDGNSEWFGGKTLDSDTGLSYFGARYYDAAIGRFMAVDPVGANPESIHLQNRYAYANNNPYKFHDPDGRIAQTVGAVGAATVSVGLFIARELILSEIETRTGIPLSGKGKLRDIIKREFFKAPPLIGKGVPKGAPEITKPYKRPSRATTKAQRESVQGKPCVDCGATTPKQYADHKDPLVKEYYRTGTIDKIRMRDVDSVQPQCPTCSNKQGAEMSRFSRQKKKELGL